MGDISAMGLVSPTGFDGHENRTQGPVPADIPDSCFKVLDMIEGRSMEYPQHHNDVVYGIQHGLQNMDICLPRPMAESRIGESVWVIFIHGGAWRDQSQDKREINPALHQLLKRPNSPTAKRIAGFASINYGLSTYARSPPEDPSSSKPADDSLTRQHPDHIKDVCLALSSLEHRFNIGTESGYDYILAGHSAGATLAFQTIAHKCDCHNMLPPIGIVGLAGIYDLGLMVKNHSNVPFYKTFVTDAFGTDTKVWDDASPANHRYEKASSHRGALESVVLAWSEKDVLIEKQQYEVMRDALVKQGWGPRVDVMPSEIRKTRVKRDLAILELNGTHDEMWERGDGLRAGIELCIQRLYGPPA